MNGTQYTFAAYAVSLGLLLGYAAILCIEGYILNRRNRNRGGRS